MKTRNQLIALPWNLVTRNLHGHELLRKKVHQKICKLEKHLCKFPTGTVHLHITLDRNPKKEFYTAGLTLRLPSNILRAEKSGPDVIKTFDDAVRSLLRELESLKAELRRESLWKRRARREALHQVKASGFAPVPQAEGEGPQSLGDVIRELLAANHRRLLRYVRRQLWHDVTAGELPPHAIDARAVVDEVARRALLEAGKKPAGLSYLLWFYILARRELARRRKALKTAGAETVSLETEKVLAEDAELAEGYDAEQPLDIIERHLEPPVVEARDLVPDTRAETPDETLARRELLAGLRRAVAGWPKAERDAFELYYVEGFEPEEVAMVLGQPPARVRTLLQSLGERIRAEVLDQALI